MRTTSSFREAESHTQRSGPAPGRFSLAVPLLLFSLFALPLIINPIVTESFDTVFLAPKVLWIYVILLPSALLVLNNWKFDWTILSHPAARITLLFCTWLLISTLFNNAGWPGWWGHADRADGVLMHWVYTLMLLCGYWWAIIDRSWFTVFCRALLFGGAALALTSVLQQLHLMGVPNANALTGVSATPYGGTLGNRGYMGGAMALLLPVTLWSFNFSLKINPRLHLLAVILISWAWVGSVTRAAILAGLISMVYMWMTHQWSQKATIAVLSGILLWCCTLLIPGDSHTIVAKVQAGLSNSGRTVLWNSAIYGISQRPLIGWGTPALIKAVRERPTAVLLYESVLTELREFEKLENTDENRFPSYQVTHQSGKRERITIGRVNKVHNEYLDYALTYGITAAIIFILIISSAIWKGHYLTPGISAGLLAYAVYLFLWPEIIRFAPLAWFMMGIALSRSPHKQISTSHFPASPVVPPL